MKGSWAWLLVGCIGSCSVTAGSKSVDMILRVLVDAPPPCTVTGAEVEFGNVVITRIGGVNYKRPMITSLSVTTWPWMTCVYRCRRQRS